MILIFGGSQAVRRFNAAVADGPAAARRAGPRHPRHRRRRLCGRAGRPGAPAGRAPRSLPAGTRSCATRCSRRSSRRISSSGGPARSTLAEVTALGMPSVIVPYPHAAGHQRANARGPRRGRCRAARRGRGIRRRRAARGQRDPRRSRASRPDGDGRSRARPARCRARSSPSWSMAAAERRPLPETADDRSALDGRRGMTAGEARR